MLQTQGVLDEADVGSQFFFLFLFLSPLSFVHLLLVLLQLCGELLQLGVTQSLIPDIEKQARLQAALQHCQRAGKVSRRRTVTNGTYPWLPQQAPIGMHENGRYAVFELQHGGPDHADNLHAGTVLGADPFEDGGVGEGELVREVRPLDPFLRSLNLAECRRV